GTGSLVKQGAGILAVSGSSSMSGVTTIQQGTLQLAGPMALGSSSIVAVAGGTLALAPLLKATVGGLDPLAGGLVDVGNGMVTVAGGLAAGDMVAAIHAGRGDGSWNGTSGITSSAAATDSSLGELRGVGWLDHGDGSVTFAFAAPGDSNLDWKVDMLDVANLLGGGKFDEGPPATWIEGDFNEDGMVDILDAGDFLATGLFDAGVYNPAAAIASDPAAAVPEPAGVVLAVIGLAFAGTSCRLGPSRCWRAAAAGRRHAWRRREV
ncbi:MAG: autotransporter-associated beta strand repeat-containing protein, partial [Planctomycetes bacterium]|nr:autotransporter-associated beta strand repeat-containing protein [Planctomycetota bacterium]